MSLSGIDTRRLCNRPDSINWSGREGNERSGMTGYNPIRDGDENSIIMIKNTGYGDTDYFTR